MIPDDEVTPTNEKGYLVDDHGNVVNKRGRVIFKKQHLAKNGEIPKIFPFTKFNVYEVCGDLDKDDLNNPVLLENDKGETIDKRGWRVNAKGYLIDAEGNILDQWGNKVFDKDILTDEG